MMRAYRGWFSAIGWLATTCATACGSSAPSEPKSQEVVVVVKLTGIPWFDRLQQGVMQASDELHIQASMVGPAQPTADGQIQIIEGLIEQRVGAIAVVPNDAAALEPILKKARDAGIIVLSHESPDQENSDWDIETIDNKAFGEKNFQTLGTLMGGAGQFALYVGGLDVTLHNYWADVGLDYAKKQWGSSMQLVTDIATDRTPCGEDASLCYQATGDLLTAFPDLKGIMAFGSQGPIGAGEKLRDLGRTDIAVVGAAIPSQAAELLKGGFIQHAYLWDPRDAGYALVAVGQRLLSGQTDLRQNAGFPGLGTATIDPEARHVVFDKILDITADNADSLGF